MSQTTSPQQTLQFPQKQFHMILQGDVRTMLAKLPDSSVDCVVTSPPYWGLRDYKIEPLVWDGTEGCEHDFSVKNEGVLRESEFSETSVLYDYPKLREVNIGKERTFFCSKCFAWKGQLGLEPTFQLYVKHIVDIFHEVKRVLKSTGALWLNLGDTYSGSGGAGGDYNEGGMKEGWPKWKQGKTNLPQKCLIGIPERVMLAMIDDGWILRNKIVWYKPNHLPSSIKDRFSNGWEFMYFFVKERKYWFDADSIRVPYAESGIKRREYPLPLASNLGKGTAWISGKINKEKKIIDLNPQGKIPDDVWSIATASLHELHFAPFPEALIERPIKASCPAEICVKCGKARERIIESPDKSGYNENWKEWAEIGVNYRLTGGLSKPAEMKVYEGKTIGWTECACLENSYRPGIVLDTFAGSGTTALVAKRLGRSSISIEVKPEYVEMIKRRIDFGHSTLDGGIEWIEVHEER